MSVTLSGSSLPARLTQHTQALTGKDVQRTTFISSSPAELLSQTLKVILILLSASTCVEERAFYSLSFKIIKRYILRRRMQWELDFPLLNIYLANSQRRQYLF